MEQNTASPADGSVNAWCPADRVDDTPPMAVPHEERRDRVMIRGPVFALLCLAVTCALTAHGALAPSGAEGASTESSMPASVPERPAPSRPWEKILPGFRFPPLTVYLQCRADVRRRLSRAKAPAERVQLTLQMMTDSWEVVGERRADLIRAVKDSFVAVVESDPALWVLTLRFHHFPVRQLGPEITPALGRALASDDGLVRSSAVEMLADLGRDAEAARPAVRALLAGDNWGIEYPARRALVAMGDEPAEHVEALTAGLRAASPDQRGWAALYLGRIGPDARGAVPALAAALDDDPSVALDAAEALGRIGVRPDAAVPALLTLVGRDLAGTPHATTVKCRAIKALAVFTGTDDRATEFVRKTLSPGSPSRWASCVAMAAARLAPRNGALAELVSQAADEQVFPVDDLLLELSIERSPGPGFIELALEAAVYGDYTTARCAVQYLGTLARRSEGCAEAMGAILAVAGSRGSPGRLAAVDAVSPGVTCMQGEAAEVLAQILAEDGYALDDEGRYIIVRHALCALADLGPAASRAEGEVRELTARYEGSKARETDEATGIVSLPELADAALAAMQPARPVDEAE
jgi:hypothetical protein